MHLQFNLQQLWFSSNFWWYDKRFLWYNNMLAFSGHVIFVNLINHKHEYSINKGHIKVENSLVFLPPHQQNFFHLRFIPWSILKYKVKIMTEKIEISAFFLGILQMRKSRVGKFKIAFWIFLPCFMFNFP